MTLDDDSVLVVSDRVLARRVADETVLLDLQSEQYFGLDGVGSRFWELVVDGVTFGSMVDQLMDEYEVDRDTLVADLRSLCSSLLEQGLVSARGA